MKRAISHIPILALLLLPIGNNATAQVYLGLTKAQVRTLLSKTCPKCIVIFNSTGKLAMHDLSSSDIIRFYFGRNGLCFRKMTYCNPVKKEQIIAMLNTRCEKKLDGNIWFEQVMGNWHKKIWLKYELLRKDNKIVVVTQKIDSFDNWQASSEYTID